MARTSKKTLTPEIADKIIPLMLRYENRVRQIIGVSEQFEGLFSKDQKLISIDDIETALSLGTKHLVRDLTVVAMIRSGISQKDIAERFGLTKGRVSQIINLFKRT